MVHRMEIAGLQRDLPLCKVSDDLTIAAFIIFGDVEMTKAAASELLKKAPEYDIMMTAEAKSIPLIYEMARQAGENDYVIARKGPKAYMTNFIVKEVESITTQHQQKLYLGEDEVAKLKGKKVLLIDDVISTGESMNALEQLVEMAGGQVVGRMAILGEGDAMERDDIIVLEPLPLFDGDGKIKE